MGWEDKGYIFRYTRSKKFGEHCPKPGKPLKLFWNETGTMVFERTRIIKSCIIHNAGRVFQSLEVIEIKESTNETIRIDVFDLV